jgi:hypothetical protein
MQSNFLGIFSSAQHDRKEKKKQEKKKNQNLKQKLE